nr:hypothetical protein [Amycolatopsis rubida]
MQQRTGSDAAFGSDDGLAARRERALPAGEERASGDVQRNRARDGEQQQARDRGDSRRGERSASADPVQQRPERNGGGQARRGAERQPERHDSRRQADPGGEVDGGHGQHRAVARRGQGLCGGEPPDRRARGGHAGLTDQQRVVTPTVFHMVMAVRSAISAAAPSSPNAVTASETVDSGTCVSERRVTSSVSASAGSLGSGEQAGFRPDRERVDPLCWHAFLACGLRMHVDAVCAAVELGRAEADQFAQGRVDARVVELLGRGVVQSAHRTGENRGQSVEIEA